MTARSLGHRAPLLWIALPMMTGLALGRLFDAQSAWPWLIGSGALVILAGVTTTRRPTLAMVSLAVAMLSAGAANYALHNPRITAWDALPPREARLTLAIERVFPQVDPLRFTALARIVSSDAPLDELAGQHSYASLTLRRGQTPPVRSAIVRASGIIAAIPRDAATNTFDGYLLSAGISFRLSRAKLVGEEKAANAYYRFCARQAERWSAILGAGVATKRPTLVRVFRAMMLGQQNELTEDQRTLFRQSGTMHVFSISGMHIVVIAGGVQALLLLLRLPRVAQFVIGLVALWLYVDITGAAPSAIRAFVMVALLETSLVLRLPLNPIAALTGSALLVVLFAPLQFFSASFQMSYGIVASLLLLGLPLADCWQEKFALFTRLPKATWRWHHHVRHAAWRGLLSTFAISIAASLVSTITGVLFFQLFTPGALWVNLWVIPAASGVMLAGFASLLCGLVGFTPGATLANHAAAVVLWLIDRGIGISAQAPAMWVQAVYREEWLGPGALAALLVSLTFGYARRWQGWQRGFWTPFALVALTLACGVRFGA
jgi:competence protein ComEC